MQVLATKYRGGIPDLLYTGHLAICDYKGNLLYSCGDSEHIAFARSSSKPFGVMPVIESGAADHYGITDSEISLMCASHNGEGYHVEAVRKVLQKAGLDERYLQCGVHYPLYGPEAERMKKEGLSPSEVHCNCSGKHSGMLITAKHLGESLEDYYQLAHPAQQRILSCLSEICDYPKELIVIGIDGCGVPVHAMPVRQMALAYAKLAYPEGVGGVHGQTLLRIQNAMCAYPKMMSGTDRLCSRIMEQCGDRLVAKSGADGFYAVGVKGKGLGLAVKIDCGDEAVRNATVVEALYQIGAIHDSDLHAFRPEREMFTYNHKKEVVGEVKIEFEL